MTHSYIAWTYCKCSELVRHLQQKKARKIKQEKCTTRTIEINKLYLVDVVWIHT